MTSYADRKQNRIDRLWDRATGLWQGADALHDVNRKLGDVMAGTPVLIGHHSQRRHERDLERIRTRRNRAYEMSDAADALEARARAAENNTAISSDDPDAPERLRERIEAEETMCARMIAGNKAIKAAKGDLNAAARALAALGFSDAAIGRALVTLGPGPAGFFVANQRASIRRLRSRLTEVQTARADVRAPISVGDVRISWNSSVNRVQIAFPGRPTDEMRAALKGRGFRWAPSEGVWQRHATEDAWYWAQQIVKGT